VAKATNRADVVGKKLSDAVDDPVPALLEGTTVERLGAGHLGYARAETGGGSSGRWRLLRSPSGFASAGDRRRQCLQDPPTGTLPGLMVGTDRHHPQPAGSGLGGGPIRMCLLHQIRPAPYRRLGTVADRALLGQLRAGAVHPSSPSDRRIGQLKSDLRGWI
jgi:hypothetical protein